MLLTMSKTSRLPARGEQGLVAAVRAGDDRAFEELYAQYSERIFAFILSKVHDHGRAEDIAQEVFMSALRRLRSADQTIAFKPWLYEIAKNACIDEFRRGRRAREVPLESDGECVVDREKSSVSAVPTPAAAVESKQRLEDLRGAFGGLSATHHQLLVMREFEGMSYDEIGQRLDMTRQMVESSLFRARRKLNEEYQELASGQRCEQIQTAIESGRLRAVSTLGIRDRRRCARHLAHCQPCRHVALMAGVDETLLTPRSIAAKIAGLLPFPVWRLTWRGKGAKAASATGSHHLAGAGSAGLVSSAGSALTFGQAAATVAAIVAAAGSGLAVHGLASGGHGHHAATASSARRVSSTSAGSAISSSAATAKKAPQVRGRLSSRPSAIAFAGSRTTAARPGTTRRHKNGSAPGAPGTSAGGGASSSASSPAHGTTASRPTASGTATKIVNGATKTVNGVSKTVGGLGQTVTNTGKAMGGVAGGAANGVDKTIHQVTGGAGNAVNGVDNTVQKVTTGLGNAVNGASNGAVDPGQAVSGVNNVLGGAGSTVANTGSNVLNGAADGATGAVNKVASGLTGGSPGAHAVPASPSGSPAAPASSPAASTSAAAGSNGAGTPTQPVASGLKQVGGLIGH
jgi:RNA polymerase sigma factor (sigma-70 family)